MPYFLQAICKTCDDGLLWLCWTASVRLSWRWVLCYRSAGCCSICSDSDLALLLHTIIMILGCLCSLHHLRITARIKYKLLSLTCKVLTTTQPSKNGWTNRDVVWVGDSVSPKQLRNRWEYRSPRERAIFGDCLDRWKAIVSHSWLLQLTAFLLTGWCNINFPPWKIRPSLARQPFVKIF